MLECSALIRVDNASILAAGSAQEGGEGAGRRPASAVGAAQGLLRRARAAAWRGARAVLRRWGWLGPCKCQQRQGQEEGPEARVGAAGGPGPADVVPFWAGHATWRPYYAMVRAWAGSEGGWCAHERWSDALTAPVWAAWLGVAPLMQVRTFKTYDVPWCAGLGALGACCSFGGRRPSGKAAR